jgi:hypothetical protein
MSQIIREVGGVGHRGDDGGIRAYGGGYVTNSQTRHYATSASFTISHNIHNVKERANLDQRFPVVDERSVRSRCVVRRLSRVAVFAGMAGAADTHSWAKPKARTGQEILWTQSDRLIRDFRRSRKRERVTGKRGRSSIESSTSQTSAIVARSIGLAVVTIRSITGFRLTALTVLR